MTGKILDENGLMVAPLENDGNHPQHPQNTRPKKMNRNKRHQRVDMTGNLVAYSLPSLPTKDTVSRHLSSSSCSRSSKSPADAELDEIEIRLKKILREHPDNERALFLAKQWKDKKRTMRSSKKQHNMACKDQSDERPSSGTISTTTRLNNNTIQSVGDDSDNIIKKTAASPLSNNYRCVVSNTYNKSYTEQKYCMTNTPKKNLDHQEGDADGPVGSDELYYEQEENRDPCVSNNSTTIEQKYCVTMTTPNKKLNQEDAGFPPREQEPSSSPERRSKSDDDGPVDLDELYEKEEHTGSFSFSPDQQQNQDKFVSSPNANEIYRTIYESHSIEATAATNFSFSAADETSTDTMIFPSTNIDDDCETNNNDISIENHNKCGTNEDVIPTADATLSSGPGTVQQNTNINNLRSAKYEAEIKRKEIKTIFNNNNNNNKEQQVIGSTETDDGNQAVISTLLSKATVEDPVVSKLWSSSPILNETTSPYSSREVPVGCPVAEEKEDKNTSTQCRRRLYVLVGIILVITGIAGVGVFLGYMSYSNWTN